ncbi:hypothetical protein AB6A40_011632 [Gnathostoma spinigerum]|uniref:Uncharacterized protein n=1 Tax=Gnathostoma spinigerum TaxID=75299 RepID=A0ABD6EY72_9BILA
MTKSQSMGMLKTKQGAAKDFEKVAIASSDRIVQKLTTVLDNHSEPYFLASSTACGARRSRGRHSVSKRKNRRIAVQLKESSHANCGTSISSYAINCSLLFETNVQFI